jgi:hypothetical protein
MHRAKFVLTTIALAIALIAPQGARAADYGESIDTGSNFTCVSRADGYVWCWGDNSFGQLGNGTFTNSKVPVRIEGFRGVIKVVTGSTHACALRYNGKVWWKLPSRRIVYRQPNQGGETESSPRSHRWRRAHLCVEAKRDSLVLGRQCLRTDWEWHAGRCRHTKKGERLEIGSCHQRWHLSHLCCDLGNFARHSLKGVVLG